MITSQFITQNMFKKWQHDSTVIMTLLKACIKHSNHSVRQEKCYTINHGSKPEICENPTVRTSKSLGSLLKTLCRGTTFHVPARDSWRAALMKLPLALSV